MEKPTIGRVVHFTDSHGNCRAAIIVEVTKDSLEVWLTWYRVNYTDGWKTERDVPFSSKSKPITWHYTYNCPHRVQENELLKILEEV